MGAANKEQVDNINEVIKTLSNSLELTSAYSPFIYCKIGDTVLATSNIDTNSNYLLSLDHEKTGTGKANQFTINVAYIPDPLNLDLDEESPLDLLDVSLIGTEIEYSYGYCFPSVMRRDSNINKVDISSLDMLRSSTYVGTIYDYTIEITNSMVNYKITGVSGVSKLKDKVLTKTSKELYELAGNTYNPIKLVKGLLEEAIEEQDLNYVVEDYVNEHGGCGCHENKKLFESIKDKALFEFINATLLPGTRSLNPDQKDLEIESESDKDSEEASKENSKDKEQTEPAKLVTFTFTIMDYKNEDEKCVITLDYSNPEEEMSESDRCVEFEFSWMSGKLTDIVQNFTPSFSGSVAIANAAAVKSLIKESAENVGVAISGDGVMEVIRSLVSERVSANSGDESITTITTALATMAIFQQTPYTASLSTMGIPYDIPILTHIKVKPMIYGKLHYTAGEYYITKQTDQISSGGFISAFEITRISPSKTTKDIADMITEIAEGQNIELKDYGEDIKANGVSLTEIYSNKADLSDRIEIGSDKWNKYYGIGEKK